jgi:hypothetical protein
MAEFSQFMLMRMLSSRAFVVNDFAGEGQALAAADFAAEAFVGAFGMARSSAGGIAQIGFPYSIANANDHRQTPNANRYHT